MLTYLHQRVTRSGVRCSGSLERRSRQMTPRSAARVYRAIELYPGIETASRRRYLQEMSPCIQHFYG
jgi:hypothetical protein